MRDLCQRVALVFLLGALTVIGGCGAGSEGSSGTGANGSANNGLSGSGSSSSGSNAVGSSTSGSSTSSGSITTASSNGGSSATASSGSGISGNGSSSGASNAVSSSTSGSSTSGSSTSSGGTAPSGLPPPAALSYPTPMVFANYWRIVTVQPSVTGTVSHWSVAPALPAGVILDQSTGEITGIPTAAQPPTTYTITAQNDAGSTSATVSITVGTLTVSPPWPTRMTVAGTSTTIDITLAPVDFSFDGTLYASVTDPNGNFSSAVSVSSPSHGTYRLSLATINTAPEGLAGGTLTLHLCSDAACTSPQPLSGLYIQYSLTILSASSEWPGGDFSIRTPWPNASDWQTFQGNAAHTGYVDAWLDPNEFTPRWQGQIGTNTDSWNLGTNMTLTTANGSIFLPAGDKLYSLSDHDASINWSYDVSGLEFPSTNPPSVASGVVYMAAGQQSSTFMFAFNATNGAVLFKTPMTSQWEHYLAPTIGIDGVYTNAGTYGGLYGFNTTGTQLFFDQEAQTSEWTPAVDANYVYSYTGSLNIVDAATGALHMTIADPTFQNYIYEIGGSVVLGASGRAFAANYDNVVINGGGVGNTLLGFDTNAGTIAWMVPGCYPTTPAYHAGLLYVANDNPVRLEVRSEQDGSLQWTWTPQLANDTKFVSEVLLTRNIAFISTNNAVYGIDTYLHQMVWGYPVAGGAKLALSANGILYIQSSGPLVAINLKNP
jgi:Putative Ig domain/PQQ-like domain